MQGWQINSTADTVTFLEVVPVTSTVVVTETATANVNATDIWAYGAWGGRFGFPAEVEFYSDRLIFAASLRQPQTMWFSRTGAYVDFGRSVPLVDSDAMSVTINARQVNVIRELVPLSDLIVMTSSAEWKMTTDNDGVVAPGKIGFEPQTYYGTLGLTAQVIGSTAIFVQGRGNIVRDMAYGFADDGYSGNDLTIFASHMVEDHQIIDVAFQQAPYNCVWLVRSDGALISLTYVREQGVLGWALHTTDGQFESVCCVPEGDENALYVSVRRSVNGTSRVHLERMHTRDLLDQRDAFFVDSGLTYSGRNLAGTITVTGGVLWTDTEELTLNASVATFTGATDIGDQIRLVIDPTTDRNGDVLTAKQEQRFRITAYVNTTAVRAYSIGDVETQWRGIAFASGNWELLRDTMSGLDHLEGETLAVLNDGNVESEKVVTGGKITLSNPGAVVHAGLPYRSLLESLDVNLQGAETVRNLPHIIGSVALLLKDSRGLKAGPDIVRLDDFKVREFEGYDDPLALVSGAYDVNVSADWDKNARFIVVQDDPLPVTILSLLPRLVVGGDT